MFEAKKITIKSRRDARKEKIEAEEAWKLFLRASKVVAAKGKKVLTFPKKEMEQDVLLPVVLGRSGTLRAPTIQIGTTIFVGYNAEIYNTLT